MSKIEVDTVEPQSGTSLTLGASGDTITIPTGATFDASAATTTLPATVVTTTGTQTLSNKTIDATQLTGTITPSDNTVTLAKLTATGTQDATTFLRGDNTFAEPSAGFTSGTAVATTSGTSIDITGIPSGTTEINVLFKAVSTNGSSSVSIQIGDGSIVTTGYTNIGGGMSASSLTNTQFTNGFVLMDSTSPSWILTGWFTLKGYGNNWFIFGGGVRDTTYPCYSFGGKTLSGKIE
jgi:hypothetical protein